MEDYQQMGKNKIISIAIIVAIGIIALVGYTYSFFEIEANNSVAIKGEVASLSLALEVKKIAPSTDTELGLIPQLDDYITSAVVGRNNKSCIDDNNNEVCQVYEIKVTNTSTAAIKVNGELELTKGNNPNLKWARISNAVTDTNKTKPTLLSEVNEPSYTNLTTEENYNAGAVKYYYIVIWISEIQESQPDNGDFTGVVRFNDSNNSTGNVTQLMYSTNLATGIPTTGIYSLTSNSDNVSYDTFNNRLKISNFTNFENYNLTFTEDKIYLNEMQVGDYVAYVGNNGCNNGVAGTTGTSNAEAGNSCLGENANQSIDENGTYGYCSFVYGSVSYRFTTYGWRIAYIEDDKVHLVSAGAPECRTISVNDDTAITVLNTAALDYCNSSYVDNNCSTQDVWAMGNSDFQKVTYAISGISSNLFSSYGTPYCNEEYSMASCGYGNDLIDNGGYYWFAAHNNSSDSMIWDPLDRRVYTYGGSFAYGFRPIISLSSSVYITGGLGTLEEPYTIAIE